MPHRVVGASRRSTMIATATPARTTHRRTCTICSKLARCSPRPSARSTMSDSWCASSMTSAPASRPAHSSTSSSIFWAAITHVVSADAPPSPLTPQLFGGRGREGGASVDDDKVEVTWQGTTSVLIGTRSLDDLADGARHQHRLIPVDVVTAALDDDEFGVG